MNRSVIVSKKNYHGYNPVQFGYEDCAPSHSFGPAIRDFWLLHYVISGTGTFTREGVTHTVKSGEIFVIPPFVQTYYEADKENPWHYQWIGFESDQPLPEALVKNHIIKFKNAGKIFEDMERCRNMSTGQTAFLSSKIWELMAVILEAERDETADNDFVQKAIQCMHSEYMYDISVAGLAKRFNVDRCYFSSLFSENVGISPSQYLINLRLEKAADLLAGHKESVSVVALSVGYSDIYNFSKAFKKKYGVSPKKYAQTNLNNESESRPNSIWIDKFN